MDFHEVETEGIQLVVNVNGGFSSGRGNDGVDS